MSNRGKWASEIHFLTTCIGFATGLGNLWRFPALAYENGGAAFVVPYVICSFVLGFPLLYLELSIGQFARVGPARCFRYFMPAAQGIGWAAIIVAYIVGIYYNMINVYSLVVLGRSSEWMRCNNAWNTEYCQSGEEDALCRTSSGGKLTYYFNGTCYTEDYRMERSAMVKSHETPPPFSSTEEFFELYVHEKGEKLEDVGEVNWQLFIGFIFIWALTALTLVKGVKWIGHISMLTATLPYFIITCIFVRAITLDGAEIGMSFFLWNPDWSYLFKAETWVQAAVQICYTLGIGFGGLLSLSSYNSEQHNCYKDAIIVVLMDSFMSVFGGSAAFSTMGFLAKKNNVELDKVIQSGTSLSFVAYPEAIGMMPWPGLWTFLFFFMFFLLGVGSQFGMTECMCSGLADQFPVLHKHKGKVSCLVCLTSLVLGYPLCTKAGIYWFTLMNEYAGTFALFAIALGEVILISHIYGIREYIKDLHFMMGPPSTVIRKYFGSSGFAILANWVVLAPICLMGLFYFSFHQYFGYRVVYGKESRRYYFPEWATAVGWILAIIPLLAIPCFFVFNIIAYHRKEGSWCESFRVQPQLRSYGRIRHKKSAETSDISLVSRSGRVAPYLS